MKHLSCIINDAINYIAQLPLILKKLSAFSTHESTVIGNTSLVSFILLFVSLGIVTSGSPRYNLYDFGLLRLDIMLGKD